ncbi:MAG: AAA family ATPase [Lachnospiraceae bacterium]|nr:AAA family ATPase [Lachnospiraceae bacterium]
MKILKLSFENINSYEGKVEIDFTDPWFEKGHNQFVICGPMGAGKSTILDAITLALYGSTARLGRLTMSSDDSSKELINKRSGYCRAVVVYSCSKGIFESTFELHKARDKADGNVQKPLCRLCRMTDGGEPVNILDSTTTNALQKENEKIIGLTYEQFIRCILIPQGEFDAFLTSDDREKARILAKLSHTEHYREAAQKLNETASDISRQYKHWQEMRNAISVMSDDDRKAAEDENQKLAESVNKQNQELEELAEKINWLGKLEDAERKLTDANKVLEKIIAGREQYDGNKNELADARNAEDCDKEYRTLCDCEEERKNVLSRAVEAKQNLATQRNVMEKDERNAKECSEDYENKKREKEKQKELWAEVRRLDNDISVAGTARKEKKRVFDDAKAEMEKKSREYDEYNKEIKAYADKLEELDKYLVQHKMDESLTETLTGYAEKRKAWIKAEKQLKDAIKDKGDFRGKQEQLLKEKAELLAEREKISDSLYELVSGKYLLVAEILRKDLKPGSCCPVCGKAVGCDDVKEQESSEGKEVTGEQNDTAIEISRLKDSLEETESAIKEKETALFGIGKDIELVQGSAEQARRTMESLTSELNEFLSPWGISVNAATDAAELEKTEKDLTDRKTKYKENKDERDHINELSKGTKAKLEAIDLKVLQEKCKASEDDFNTEDKKYTDLADQRGEKFGDKSVDKAEEEFENELGIKEKAKTDADKKLQDTQKIITGLETEINGLKKREEDVAEKQETLKTAFGEKLKKYRFASEADFLDCRREKEYIEKLEERIREYEKEKTAAETAYGNAKSELESLRAENRTSESLGDLKEREKELNQSKSENDQKIGSLIRTLETDNENREKRKDADEKLQELGNEAEIYSRISEMLGKKDGSDFEVFVQGIAMRSLLEKANAYLQSIIPNYCLVQTALNSVSFHVHERMGDGTVQVRELRNFSGGEKFIISLSLALAMAEFAGQNGDVECIFLDEGFGTLSGEPLIEAINALKKLSSSGKMLGIITHIDTVVNQFNRIVAEKRGERSVLSGGGVSYTELGKKKAR